MNSSGKKHFRAGGRQRAGDSGRETARGRMREMGAEPDEKTEAAIDDFRFLFYSLKKIRGTDPMITGKKSLAEFLVHDVLP